MSAELLIANLLRIAKEDLDGSRLLLARGNRNAAYLCEQAAEKIIRAVLSSEGRHAGISHRLNEFVDLVPDENPLKQDFRTVEHLGAYATTYRYPTAVGRIPAPLSPEALALIIAKVETTLDAAAVGFRVDLSKPDTPAGSAVPIR